jgi:hypothetical protein
MSYTTEQVIAAAPDAQVAAAGKKLADAKHWLNLGRDAEALWGECQGSAVYQVRVALADLTSKCSCPSRKFPCKHGLGLLLLAAQSPARVAEGTQPEWVASWLAKRGETAVRKATPAEKKVDAAAQAKRAATRHERVLAGLDALDRWMNDLVRNGLAELETKGPALWEREGARLVDAQAPALASRLRAIANLPGAPNWGERVLGELGRIALLTHAYRRIEQLDAPIAADVRTAIGWTLTEEEVRAHGDTVADEWLILGSAIEEDDRVRLQRTWLVGLRSNRTALVLQFAAGAASNFAEVLLPGTSIDADLTFWPSAQPQRALITARRSNRSTTELRAHATFASMLDAMATIFSAQPWLRHAGVAIENVVPMIDARGEWSVRDRDDAVLPLAGRDHWRLLALSGGAPIGIAAEWDGVALAPLGGSTA